MGIVNISNNGKINYNIKEIICDTYGDLPLDGLLPGSRAYVVDEEKHYILNTKYEWKELKSGKGGGGGSGRTYEYYGDDKF